MFIYDNFNIEDMHSYNLIHFVLQNEFYKVISLNLNHFFSEKSIWLFHFGILKSS